MNTSMSRPLCPLWGGNPLVTKPLDVDGVWFVYSPRAGGVYGLTGEWGLAAEKKLHIPELRGATPRQKANLSHWIYRQNLEAGLLRSPADPVSVRHNVMYLGLSESELVRRAPRLDPETVKAQYARTPSALDRRLYLLNELLLQQDMPEPQDKQLQNRVYADYRGFRAAAAAWETDSEPTEFLIHFKQRGWLGKTPGFRGGSDSDEDIPRIDYPAVCTLDARLWVEEQLRERGTGQQVFVAMWFDPTLDNIYKEGFKKGIAQAGYAPYRVDQDAHHSDKLDDRVLAGIRQSRIMVADFTCEEITREGGDKPEGLPNGNVHYEAGFAHGLGLPVIYTCRQDCKGYLRFDTRQINHIFWRDAADLARQLQVRLKGQFGHGPVQQAPDA